MQLKLEISKGIISELGALLKDYRCVVEFLDAHSPGYKDGLFKRKKYDLAGGLEHHLKDNAHLNQIVKHIFENPGFSQHYTERGVKEIILQIVAEHLFENKSLTLPKEEFEKIRIEIIKKLSTLGEKIFAFQIEHLKYSGEDIEMGPCKLVTWDLTKMCIKATKVAAAIIPQPNLIYKNFVVVTIFCNDRFLAPERALSIANCFCALLKLTGHRSPRVRLSEFYLVPWEDGWTPGYKSREILHWDLEIADKKTILGRLGQFLQILNNSAKNDLYESIELSLARFSNAMTLNKSSLRLAEMVGCLGNRSERTLTRFSG